MKPPKSHEHVIEELLSKEPFAEIEAGLTVHFAKLHAEQAREEASASVPASVEKPAKPRKTLSRKPRKTKSPKPGP